ncbi:DUF2796 domain-containing protein [Gemmatimonadales bacterium]|nr:DUF2796 domain-containing protein [Gemmatimonadales bacterium]
MFSSEHIRRAEGIGLSRLVVFTILTLGGCSSGNERGSGPLVEGDLVGVAGAHEHGVVRIGLAVDDRMVSMDLEVPAATVFGFEHAPKTEDELEMVSEGLAALRARVGEIIAISPEFGCELEDFEVVDAPDVEESEGAEDEHAHSEDEHAHSEDEHAHSEDEDAHSEIRVAVSWSCVQSIEASSATLRLGSLWPDVALVDLTVMTSRGQAAGRVGADASFSF